MSLGFTQAYVHHHVPTCELLIINPMNTNAFVDQIISLVRCLILTESIFCHILECFDYGEAGDFLFHVICVCMWVCVLWPIWEMYFI